jgi:hypothetical protein
VGKDNFSFYPKFPVLPSEEGGGGFSTANSSQLLAEQEKKWVIFVQPLGRCYSSVIESVGKDSGVRMVATRSLAQAAAAALKAPGGVMVCAVQREERFRNLVDICQQLRQPLSEGKIRLLVLASYLSPANRMELSQDYGAEILEAPLAGRTLAFKIAQACKELRRPCATDPRP